MSWIQLSAALPKVEAEWMAADVATRMTTGKAVIVKVPFGWQVWRTGEVKPMNGFKQRRELPGENAIAFLARYWHGRCVAPLADCIEAGQVLEVKHVAV